MPTPIRDSIKLAIDFSNQEFHSANFYSEIAERWPDKLIRYVVATHAHDDHIGGLRAYAAQAATIITSEAGRPEVEHILNSSHTLRPDSFQINPLKQVKIETLPDDEKKTISDGNRTIEIYPVNNTHSKDMLAVYLPSEQILLDSDLYSPGANGGRVLVISPAGLENYFKEVADSLKSGPIIWELEQEIAKRYGQEFLEHLKHWGQ
ncbi:MAG: MBL fold metallo-hydrolase [Nitrososphaeraceae archaeon]